MPFGILRCKIWNIINIFILNLNYCAYYGLFFLNLTERNKQYILLLAVIEKIKRPDFSVHRQQLISE